jgi:hypothetical protein
MSEMTVEEVFERVNRISAMKGDSEAAHAAEDGLLADVLAAIRDGAPNPTDLAAAALRATQLEYDRWYA